jgi:hypothetical protein
MSTQLLILESYIRELFLFERRRNKKKRNRKPGGPRSDIGALRQLNTDAFATKVKGAVKAAAGDVHAAANKLDVAPRTLYGYLEDSSLESVVTTSDMSDEKKKLPRNNPPDELIADRNRFVTRTDVFALDSVLIFFEQRSNFCNEWFIGWYTYTPNPMSGRMLHIITYLIDSPLELIWVQSSIAIRNAVQIIYCR